MKLIFATHNHRKALEMRQILAGLDIDVVSADEAGVTEDVIEDGKTFADNALKKARFVAGKSGQWSVADDSGLCVTALNDAPGVFSARYAGEGAKGSQMVAKLLDQMKGVPEGKRQAWFASTAALVAPDGRHWIFSGKVSGRIAATPRGEISDKMPYDTVFIPDGFRSTFSEMRDDQKNGLSHRGMAFRQLKRFLSESINK
jgi:XTP/dITP diphosphohydrolase